MNFLLDTHTFLWFIDGSDELSQEARKTIENTANFKFISIATFWEIAIKINIGKLDIDLTFDELEGHVFNNGFEMLPITFQHTAQLVNLPLHHKDPFDRIIIAQARCEDFYIISKDPSFEQYGLKMKW